MGQLRSAVRAYATEGHDPATVLARTGRLLTDLDTELLATCCFLLLDVTSGTAEIALAGHPAPLICGPDGRIGAAEVPPGVPLGVPSADPYRVSELTLPAGTLLLLYTDGVTRSSDVPGAAESLLASCLKRTRTEDSHLEDLADLLIGSVPDSAERRDDVALLLARYGGARPDPRRRISSMAIQRHDLRAVKKARTFLRDRLGEWGLDHASEDMMLMASEVVTNALIHADSDVEMRLREYPDRVRLEVRDADPTPPIPSIAAAGDAVSESEHGRGLFIVDSFASSWGSSPSGRGKTVWLEIRTRP
jgi:anti-sigma regulatory factor (Ser/Thr protein kinase)